MEPIHADIIRQTIAQLRISPLINIDPNDSEALKALALLAYQKCEAFELDMTCIESLKLMALSINQWGNEFDTQDWAKEILNDKNNESLLRVQELQLYKIFEQAGPEAVDFPTYCILKFRRSVPTTSYENSQIHYVADMGLEIAKQHNITDLLNSYACVELILVIGDDFMTHPKCVPLKNIFKDHTLQADQKIKQSYDWLSTNIQDIYA